MIHKRRRLPRCPITQSSESMQQSVHRFLSHTSLQKVFKLILPPNRRHFLPNRRVFRLFYDKRPTNPEYMTKMQHMEWSAFVFPSHERCYLIFNTSIFISVEKSHLRVTLSGYKNFTLCRENFVYSENGVGLENQFPRSLAWLQELWKTALDHRGRHPSRNRGNTKTFVGSTTK